MDTVHPGVSKVSDADAEQVVRDLAGIAVAEREIADGLYVDFDDVRAWVDSLGTQHELPTPSVRRR